MRNPFQASSEKLPPSDPHDELVRTVDARCAQLREKCWKMRYIVVSKAKKIPFWGI